MRRLIIPIALMVLFGIFLINCTPQKCQENNFKVEKYATICKVWGLLKYHHPGVGSGKLNWDDTLLSLLNSLDTIDNKRKLNKLISDIFTTCNSIKNEEIDTSYLKGEVKFKRKQKWLEDTTYISKKNIVVLKNIIANKKPYNNYYVTQNKNIGNLDYSTEITYSDSTCPSKNLRLLSLFRHWNIINYHYPHVEINDSPWEEVLKKYIPIFISANDSLEYHLTVLEYTSQINDGHIWTESYTLAMYMGIYSPPYKVTCVENRPVISKLFPDSIGKLYNVHEGDEVIAVNNSPVEEIIKLRSKYYPNSNKNQYTRRIYEELLITPNPDSIIIDINRNGSIFQEVVPTFYLFELYEFWNRQEAEIPAFEIINDSIGYINLKYLDLSEIAEIMAQVYNCNKIIIDIRNYPRGVLYELVKYFNPEPIEFVKVFVPSLVSPGEFIWLGGQIKAGDYNPDYYKGKLVLIVNDHTQSHAEFTAMCLQTAPDVITIGSMTAGTDGNMSKVRLPGGIDTYFTGIGIEYPDGTPTQRIGLKIDTIVEPKIGDISKNFDRVLETAIKL